MNPRVKKKLLKALRSDEYVQGFNSMCQNSRMQDSFCPLGVLCQIHAEETGGSWEADEDVGLSYGDNFYTLPSEVLRWAGLGTYDDVVRILNPDGSPTSLATLNDTDRLSFPEIADVIESSL